MVVRRWIRNNAPFAIHKVPNMYRQILDPVAHSLGWSSLVAALPRDMAGKLPGVVVKPA